MTTIYIADWGDDANDGTEAKPVKTWPRAFEVMGDYDWHVQRLREKPEPKKPESDPSWNYC